MVTRLPDTFAKIINLVESFIVGSRTGIFLWCRLILDDVQQNSRITLC